MKEKINFTIMLFVIIILVVILIFLQNKEQIGFKFSQSNCQEISPYNKSELGIKNITWKNNELQVKALISINCAEKITSGNYEIVNNKIILKYSKMTCNPCTLCMCARELIYKFKNLERKDYTFELKQV